MTGDGPPGVMGVLNVTPDSFSDGGQFDSVDRAVARVATMIDEGASVIDVGGESTRPGAVPVSPDEEQRRVVPVIDAIAPICQQAGVRISIDTRHETTARAAVAHGASIINDVSASLWPTAADLGVAWVAMHMSGDPATMQREPHYDDVVAHVRRFLAERGEMAESAGVPEVWVDPGFGFGKTTAHNLALLARLDSLVGDGRPVLVGISRKRSLGVLLARSDSAMSPHPLPPGGDASFDEVDPVSLEDRVDGSLITATWAMIHGARMVRAHDIAMTVQAATVVSGRFSGSRRVS